MKSSRDIVRRNSKKLYAAGIILFLLFISVSVSMSAQQPPVIDGCPIFPANNAWNTPIDHLPLDLNSAAYIATIGATRGLHPDFASGTWDGGPIGIPFNVVSGSQQKVDVTFDYDDESDPGPYPLPPDALIEGGSQSGGDRHVLVLDRDNCMLYETWSSYIQPDGSWQAGSGAVFDLNSNTLRPYGWTSADAAGLPVLPGLVRYDEVASGEIRHAIRFTAPQTRNTFVWPARHYASDRTGGNYPPMGQRFRLKSGFDISQFSPELQVIFLAMKKYGIILADNGSAWYISGVPDPRWDDDMLVSGFSRVRGADFEAVDASGLIIQSDSGEACASLPVRSSGAYYDDLSLAYDALPSDGGLIQSQAVVIVESPDFSKNISVTIQGGYACNYSTVIGSSIIRGTITISGGTVTLDGISIE
ncbi:MAG: hypothetical protein WA610_03585 [Thermodesulfovibrionales bacterium]